MCSLLRNAEACMRVAPRADGNQGPELRTRFPCALAGASMKRMLALGLCIGVLLAVFAQAGREAEAETLLRASVAHKVGAGLTAQARLYIERDERSATPGAHGRDMSIGAHAHSILVSAPNVVVAHAQASSLVGIEATLDRASPPGFIKDTSGKDPLRPEVLRMDRLAFSQPILGLLRWSVTNGVSVMEVG